MKEAATDTVAALTDEQVLALRARTPGAGVTVHLNHAGASLPSQATLDAVIEHLRREAVMGPMEAAAAASVQLEQARQRAALLLNATPGEIALPPCNSAGWGAAFAALGPWRPGDRILVGRQEWGGNLATMLHGAGRAGARVETIPCEADGQVSAEALEAMVDERVRLISLTWLPANGGLINPAAAIGAVARRHDIAYFIDAAQALGQIPADVRALGCDVLVGAARKALRAPRGTAIMYVRQAFLSRLDPVYLDTWSAPIGDDGAPEPRADAAVLEHSETAVALRCGLANALGEALELGIPAIRARVDRVARDLRDRLRGVAGVALHDLGCEHSGLVSFSVAGVQAAMVRQTLANQGISVAANGLAYTPLDMRARNLHSVVRASVSYLTTDAELARLVAAVAALR